MEERAYQKFTAGAVYICLAIAVLAAYLGALPKGLVGSMAIMLPLGLILENWGNRTPILKDYLGGAPLLCIFVSAALFYYQLMPAVVFDNIISFMKGSGSDFLNFYIAALICGSILGVDSKLLLRAGARYAVPLLAGVAGAVLFGGLAALIFGYGWSGGIMNVVFPIMGGGMGAGAVPMSEIIHRSTGDEIKSILSILIPALALGNLFSIIYAGLLDKLGKIKPKISGSGRLMRQNFEMKTESLPFEPSIWNIAIGISVSSAFYVMGKLFNYFLPQIHSYAYMIILVALFKVFGLVPRWIIVACNSWYQIVAKVFTGLLLVGIGIAYTDLGAVLNTISLSYVVIVLLTVSGALLGSGLGGHLVGFHFIESSLTAGLCMSNMGGTGDVAVLSAARRMELMPFAQISSRLGGALILVILSAILPFFRG